jgi:hypothetical protein
MRIRIAPLSLLCVLLPAIAYAQTTSISLNTRAGWGFMVLTNMLPAQGNGTYVFYIWGQDREGNTQLLGTRTITCDNAHATKPFGALDTPAQGGVASGGAYVNFGWALTPLQKTIPTDGSTITVLVDGVAAGTAEYNNFRADIATLFPGLNNTSGAIGFRVLDTTRLVNGMHTISRTVMWDSRSCWRGWAADLDAAHGTGIATLHAWAYPLTGGPPVFLGATAYGGARPDVAAVHGEQFQYAGFNLAVQGLPHGNYDLAVFAWGTVRADFVPAALVRATVR